MRLLAEPGSVREVGLSDSEMMIINPTFKSTPINCLIRTEADKGNPTV